MSAEDKQTPDLVGQYMKKLGLNSYPYQPIYDAFDDPHLSDYAVNFDSKHLEGDVFTPVWSGDQHCVVYGVSGSGKTALLRDALSFCGFFCRHQGLMRVPVVFDFAHDSDLQDVDPVSFGIVLDGVVEDKRMGFLEEKKLGGESVPGIFIFVDGLEKRGKEDAYDYLEQIFQWVNDRPGVKLNAFLPEKMRGRLDFIPSFRKLGVNEMEIRWTEKGVANLLDKRIAVATDMRTGSLDMIVQNSVGFEGGSLKVSEGLARVLEERRALVPREALVLADLLFQTHIGKEGPSGILNQNDFDTAFACFRDRHDPLKMEARGMAEEAANKERLVARLREELDGYKSDYLATLWVVDEEVIGQQRSGMAQSGDVNFNRERRNVIVEILKGRGLVPRMGSEGLAFPEEIKDDSVIS